MNKIITRIENQKKDNSRYSVYIDGVFAFGLSEKALKKYNLQEGMQFLEEEYAQFLQVLQLEKAKFKALDYISRRNRTKQQVEEKLVALEYEESIREQVIIFLETYKYIDDERFAERYIEQQMQYNHKSFRKVGYDLYEKGIKVNKRLEDMLEEIEKENIIYYLNKYKYNKEILPKEKDKIIKRLLSRGFGYNLISKEMGNLDESFDI